MALNNQNEAERKLTRIINANFNPRDYFITLTYTKKNRPTPEQAKDFVKDFLKDMRKIYRQQGTILKYVHVTEYKDTAIHHHFVMNKVNNADIIDILGKTWRHGGKHTVGLYEDGEYSKLAEYLIKETSKSFNKDKDKRSHKQRYSCSRNLIRPVPIKEIISKAKAWLKTPKPKQGYFIPKHLIFEYEYEGRPIQRYTMISLDMNAPPIDLADEELKRWLKCKEDWENQKRKKGRKSYE